VRLPTIDCRSLLETENGDQHLNSRYFRAGRLEAMLATSSDERSELFRTQPRHSRRPKTQLGNVAVIGDWSCGR